MDKREAFGMTKTEKQSGQFVTPGDRLGVIEEFTPGSGTYSERGIIYSKTTGSALMDLLNKKVTVYPFVQPVSVPKTGNIVSGQILDVKGKTATLRITHVNEKPLSGSFTGILHISDISQTYVENIFSAYKAGDIVRAKVISDKNRTLYLTTAERELGALYAFCSRCGHILTRKKQQMRCPKCNNIERRKTSLDYREKDAAEGN